MNIFVSNLSFKVVDEDLRNLFEEYGEVQSAKVIIDRETGRSKGFGFVEMPDDEAAKKAIEELHQAEYDGKIINVNEAKPRENKPRTGGGYGGGSRFGRSGGSGRSGGGRGGYGNDNRR